MLETGKPFPAFSLPNQDGATTSLADFKGKWLSSTAPQGRHSGLHAGGQELSARSRPSTGSARSWWPLAEDVSAQETLLEVLVCQRAAALRTRRSC